MLQKLGRSPVLSIENSIIEYCLKIGACDLELKIVVLID